MFRMELTRFTTLAQLVRHATPSENNPKMGLDPRAFVISRSSVQSWRVAPGGQSLPPQSAFGSACLTGTLTAAGVKMASIDLCRGVFPQFIHRVGVPVHLAT